jgi:hypothetical protein
MSSRSERSKPKTRAELEAAGYDFLNQAKCRGCGAAILWFSTPKGKRMPFDAATLEPHWATCPQAEEFKKPKMGKTKPKKRT